jgi:hypothetical protein
MLYRFNPVSEEKMHNSTCRKSFIILSSSVLLMACNSDSSTTQKSVSVISDKPVLADSAWVQSAQKHNNSGLAMRYKLNGELAIGQPVTITFEFSGAKFSDAQVSILTPKALAAQASTGLQKTSMGYHTDLKLGEVNAHSITFTPNSDGEHFISVQLSQNGQTSAAGVMLRVGQKNTAAQTIGERVTTENGEKLIVMPAK